MSKDVELMEIPHSGELEQQVLSMILLNNKLIDLAVETIAPKMFHDDLNKEIYIAMVYYFHNHVPITYETILDRLNAKKIEGSEVVDYVIALGNVPLRNTTIEEKLELLVDEFQKREMYKLALDIVTKPMKGVASQNLVKKVEGAIENMGISSNVEIEKFQDYIDDWLVDMEDDTPIESYKLGYKLLDDIVLLEGGNLLLIGARPSVGKSAFATNIVKNFCLQNKKPLFVSLEMTKKEYMNRLVANMSGVEARKLKRKEYKTKDEWKRIMVAKEQIRKFQFSFYDKGGMKIEQLVGLCKYLKKKGELDVLVIDYLQLLESNQYKGQKQNQVGYISQKLKQIAMELEIPVIALSQLSRGSIEHGKPREPYLSDLRDSGSLEQDANVVIMLHTDDIEQKFQDERFIKLFIRKNRDGKLGEINYTYVGDYVRFIEKEWNDDAKCYVEVEQDDLTISDTVEELGLW